MLDCALALLPAPKKIILPLLPFSHHLSFSFFLQEGSELNLQFRRIKLLLFDSLGFKTMHKNYGFYLFFNLQLSI